MRAKIIDGVFTPAPRKIEREIDGEQYITYNPTDEMLAEQGWLNVVETPVPGDAPEGYHYEPTYTEWQTETGREIRQDWMLVQDEITEEIALTRYANEVTGADDPDLISAAETMIKKITEV